MASVKAVGSSGVSIVTAVGGLRGSEQRDTLRPPAGFSRKAARSGASETRELLFTIVLAGYLPHLRTLIYSSGQPMPGSRD
jgi:hypothetical protein